MQSGSKRYSSWLCLGLVLILVLGSPAQEPQTLRHLVVEEVVADSSAAKAGLKVGDRLITYDGKPLTSPAALQAAEENTFDKNEIVLSVRRRQETLTLTVPLGGLGIKVHPELLPAALKLYEEGQVALQAQKSEEAIAKWTAAAKAEEEAGDEAAAAWLHGRGAGIYEDQRQWEEASAAHTKAWELLKQSGDAAAKSRTLSALGLCTQNLNDFPVAERWYEQAWQVDTVAGNQMWVADDLNKLGKVAYYRGDLAVAQDYYSRALAIHERLVPNSRDVAKSLNNLGVIAMHRADLAAAQDYHRCALAIKERLAPNSLDVAVSLNNLGNVAYYRRDLQSAHDYYSRALTIRESLAPESLDVARSLGSLGNIAADRGDLSAAYDYYNRALTIFKRLMPNSRYVATTLNNLGLIAHDRGDLSSAHDYFTRALTIRERLAPHSLDVAYSLIGLGNITHARGDFQAAHDYYNRALTIFEKLVPDGLDVAWALMGLGIVARDRGHLEAAHDYFGRALAIQKQRVPNSLDLAKSLGNLGITFYRRGDLQAAHDYFSRALAMRERLAPNSLAVAESLTDLGYVALDKRRFPEAESLFSQAVEIIESHRRQIPSTEARAFVVARYIKPFSGLLRTHLALNDLPAAFAALERARSRSLVELLFERRLDFRADAPAELLKQQDELNRKRSAAYTELAKLDAKKDSTRIEELQAELTRSMVQQRELEAQIKQTSPKFAALEYPDALDFQEMQAMLDSATLLLSYYVDEKESYLFAVTKTDLKLFIVPIGEKALSQQVREFREEILGSPQQPEESIEALHELGEKLYEALIRPAQDLVDQAQRILISPNGPLHTLPFSALGSQSQPELHYFIEDKPLNTIFSMTVYAETRRGATHKEAKPEVNLLAFGDPVYAKTRPVTAKEPVVAVKEESGRDSEVAYLMRRGLKFYPLPGTRTEVQGIAKYFGNAATIRLGKEATETAAKQESQDADIVHFACHAWLDEQMGLSSGLALSQPEALGRPMTAEDNGLLQAWEIFEHVRLKADLVVLSACDTGLGEELRGEGLIGLTRAFLYAGARSVVVSLWKVDDAATAELMKRFYRGILKEGLRPAEALRAAQVEMWKTKRWKSPYFWAAFVLQGEWR